MNLTQEQINYFEEWGNTEKDFRLEFLTDPQGCLNESGIYFRDDVLEGIISKFYDFYAPLIDAAYFAAKKNNNCPEYISYPDIIIEPSYDNRTTVCIVSGRKVLFHDILKAWHFWFESDEQLEAYNQSVYEEVLEELLIPKG